MQAEIIALRHQLTVLQRSQKSRRPVLTRIDGCLWVWLFQDRRRGGLPAWDSGSLPTIVKNSPARASDAHISIIGHFEIESHRVCVYTSALIMIPTVTAIATISIFSFYMGQNAVSPARPDAFYSAKMRFRLVFCKGGL
jgi:hypothetical protein